MSKLNPRLIFWFVFTVGAVLLAALFVKSDFIRAPERTPVVKDVEEEKQPLVILFGGDIFLDRSIRRQIEANSVSYPWQNIADFLKSYKYKVANLEGPVFNRSQAAPAGSFSFAFQEDHVKYLAEELKFTALSLANNHTNNQGQQALVNSREFLANHGVIAFGDPNNVAEFSFWKGEWDGKKIAFVGEHNLYSGDPQHILPVVSQLDSEGYFVIVLPHWGPEYVLTIPTVEENRAHALIDAGADLIIGAHPHVVQPIEIYEGKTIFYSLGNFLFDQGFSYDTMHGLLVETTFEESGLRFKLFPTEQNNTFQASLASEEAKNRMLARLAAGSVVDEHTKENIRAGEFFVPYNIDLVIQPR